MRSNIRFLLAMAFIMIVMLISTGNAIAIRSTPRLNLISPRGVQRGFEHVLRFSGVRLSETQQVFLYDTGVEVIELKQVDANNVDVTIKVDADCRLGEHIAQIRTSRGISDFRSFYVGALKEINEIEQNGSPQQSQTIELNKTINGVIESEDVDVYKVTAKKGQRLSVEIEAIRLGFMFDPFIAILDEQDFEIAISDDSMHGNQDGVISIVIPNDGNYFVLVRESSYRGNANCRYRLHVGEFPRPTVVFPSAGNSGKELDVRFLGDNTGEILERIEVPESAGFRSGLFVIDELGITPSPVAFRSSELPSHVEIEPNEDRDKLDKVGATPCAFDGIISQQSDVDYFKFSATKNQNLDIECFARRMNSGLDPVINIFDAKGKHLVGDDDARRPDCYLRFTPPESADYFLRVRDHLNRGQDDFVYRVELNNVGPSLKISIPRIDRYSQLRQQICVPQGNRFATMISATRTNFGGELKLLPAKWPEGITMDSRPMVANLNLVPVVFAAADDAALTGKLVELKASHVDDAKNIVGNFSVTADFALGPPNNSKFYTADVDKLACAITKALPFKMDIVQPKVPLVRNGSMNLKIVATRDEGFDAPITIQFPFRPPGLGTKPQIVIKKGETEGYYPLNANGSAQLGNWPVYAIGQSNVDGPVWASTQLAEIEIADPFVLIEMNRTTCHQGESTNIYCKLNHRLPFEGEAIAEILGVPPNIQIPKLTFTKEDQELNFNVTTNEKSPIGKHKGLFCRVTIYENGESIVSTAARSELQINPPKQTQIEQGVATNKTKKENDASAIKPKPKSRLQQLRDAALEKGAK